MDDGEGATVLGGGSAVVGGSVVAEGSAGLADSGGTAGVAHDEARSSRAAVVISKDLGPVVMSVAPRVA